MGLPKVENYIMPTEKDVAVHRLNWVLERNRTALLVHDMQAYFLSIFDQSVSPFNTLASNCLMLISFCRQYEIPIFYTAQKGNQDRRDRGLQADLWGPGMRATLEHEAIYDPIRPGEHDFTLTKHRYSAFQRSNLETMMNARGRDQLIICGVYAHIGCALTAVEAFQRDIQPFIACDAMADFSKSKHVQMLNHAASCYARVLETARLLEEVK